MFQCFLKHQRQMECLSFLPSAGVAGFSARSRPASALPAKIPAVVVRI